MTLSLDRIEALAPDQGSVDAARKLLKPGGWPKLAADGAALIWGECQGSGATPYRVVVSEADAGYKCTCPSRKFPCKHSLALMWLRVDGKVAFATAEPPEWVREWVARRRVPGVAASSADEGRPKVSLAQAKASTSVTDLADLIRASLVADVPDAAIDCIEQLQALAMRASDLTDLMQAVAPLVRVLRYGSARKLPEDALRALIVSLSAEVNAGVRTGSHALDEESAAKRIKAMNAYDEALRLFGDDGLTAAWRTQLGTMVDDDQVAPAVAGLSLGRLHDASAWPMQEVAAAFSRQMSGHVRQQSGVFLEGFLSGGSEVILHDHVLLQLVDAWLCELPEQDFVESLPLLRRSLSGFDAVSRRRLMEQLKHSRGIVAGGPQAEAAEDNQAFAAALPLLYKILGVSDGGAT